MKAASTAKKPPAGEDHSKRPIRVDGHQYPAQWLRGGEAGEGRVLGQRVGGIWAGRLTVGAALAASRLAPGRAMASFSIPPIFGAHADDLNALGR